MGRDAGHSKGMPKSSSVSLSDEKFGMFSSESKFWGSGRELGRDGDRILGQGSVGGLSKFIGGLGVGKNGDGDQTECGGGVVFGEESEGEGISNSLWGELSKFIGGLGVGKKGDGDRMESRGVWYLVKKVQGKVERL